MSEAQADKLLGMLDDIELITIARMLHFGVVVVPERLVGKQGQYIVWVRSENTNDKMVFRRFAEYSDQKDAIEGAIQYLISTGF